MSRRFCELSVSFALAVKVPTGFNPKAPTLDDATPILVLACGASLVK